MTFTSISLIAQGITVDICGQILDPTGKCIGFEGVKVDIKDAFGNVICTTTSGLDGHYCCTVPANATPVDICPEINCQGKVEGLSTLDLIIIQRYILGLPNETDPNGTWPSNITLWADVNGDGSISVADLILLRNLILGNNTSHNTCRLVNQDCLVTRSPPDYHTCYDNCFGDYDPFSLNNGTYTNFFLYRIGDVNNSWDPPPGCSAPLWTDKQDQWEIRSLISKESIYYDNLSNKINFYVEKSIYFLVLELEFEKDLKEDDFLIYNHSLKPFINENKLIITYFSNSLQDKIQLKEILKVTDRNSIKKTNFDNSALITDEGVFGLELQIKPQLIKANSTLIKIAEHTNIVTIYDNSPHLREKKVIISTIDGKTVFMKEVRISAEIGFEIDLAEVRASGLLYVTVQSKDTGDVTSTKLFKFD